MASVIHKKIGKASFVHSKQSSLLQQKQMDIMKNINFKSHVDIYNLSETHVQQIAILSGYTDTQASQVNRNAIFNQGMLTIQMQKAGIISPLRIAHFLAQAIVETGNFTNFRENLNYSVKTILESGLFKLNKKQKAIAKEVGRKTDEAPLSEDRQRQVADLIYESEDSKKLGNKYNTDDGYIFRGRGIFQLTGRTNYTAFATNAGIAPLSDFLADPDAVATNMYIAVASACWYWNVFAKLNPAADSDDMIKVTKTINKGLAGLPERKFALEMAKLVLGVSAPQNDVINTLYGAPFTA